MPTMDVEKLWQSYSITKDKSIKEKLIKNYLPLIKHIVSRINISLPHYLGYEDLISYGIFGLMQAIERYDVTKGIKFETYAYARIKGSIIDELRKLDWVPQGTRKRQKCFRRHFRN